MELGTFTPKSEEKMKDFLEVSRGTLRLQDLIPTFRKTLKEVSDGWSESYPSEWPDENSPWWETEEAMDTYVMLFTDLCFWAPDGYYFGISPEDNSLFGFWKEDKAT
jgi:hypothetical protein